VTPHIAADTPLLHLVPAEVWAQACRAGEHRPPSLATEGFVHLSWPRQLAGTVARHYAGVAGLLVLVVDPERLADPVVEEEAPGVGDRFPHLYGPLPVAAVVAAHPLDQVLEGSVRLGP
jgi:uncharacterized protein (DUF952 family)